MYLVVCYILTKSILLFLFIFVYIEITPDVGDTEVKLSGCAAEVVDGATCGPAEGGPGGGPEGMP